MDLKPPTTPYQSREQKRKRRERTRMSHFVCAPVYRGRSLHGLSHWRRRFRLVLDARLGGSSGGARLGRRSLEEDVTAEGQNEENTP